MDGENFKEGKPYLKWVEVLQNKKENIFQIKWKIEGFYEDLEAEKIQELKPVANTAKKEK